MGLVGDDSLHAKSIFALVTLGTCCLDGRSPTGVEGFLLEGGEVGIKSHLSAERIKFKDKMAFGQSADRRVAGHPSDRVKETRHQKGVHAHARGDESRLRAGMTSSNDYDVKLVFHAD